MSGTILQPADPCHNCPSAGKLDLDISEPELRKPTIDTLAVFAAGIGGGAEICKHGSPVWLSTLEALHRLVNNYLFKTYSLRYFKKVF